MPTFDNDMDVTAIPGGGSYKFSAVRPQLLGATEYTLVSIFRDISGSVSGFAKEIDKMTLEIVKACNKSPRAENLLLRLVDFNHNLYEIHGFQTLSMIDPYKPIKPDGMTALYDAVYTGIEATLMQAETLLNNDFAVNGIVFIMTDGANNSGIHSPKQIATKMKEAMTAEKIESLKTILVGVNDIDCKAYLDDFAREASLSQFVSLGEATAQKLAKLAEWVSTSISSQSQALGTGGPSQNISLGF